MQMVVCRDLLHRFDSPDCLQRYPRLELRTVISSFLFHISVVLGYTPQSYQKLTISLAPFQRATSVVAFAGLGEASLLLGRLGTTRELFYLVLLLAAIPECARNDKLCTPAPRLLITRHRHVLQFKIRNPKSAHDSFFQPPSFSFFLPPPKFCKISKSRHCFLPITPCRAAGRQSIFAVSRLC
jgi:hypothetical protein